MAEAADKVGVVADFVIEKFKVNAAEYNRILKQVDSVTMEVAQRMQAMGVKYEHIEAVVGQAAAAQLEYAVDTEQATHALEEHAAAQEQVANTQEEVAEATEETTDKVEKQSRAISFSIKKMVLWTIGAASVYRLYMKLRRAAMRFITEVVKGTKEEARLTAANKELKAAMAAAFGPTILESIRSVTSAVKTLTGYMTNLAVQMEVNHRIMEVVAKSTNTQAQYMLLMGGNAQIVAELTGLNVDMQELYADALDAVNQRVDEFNAKSEEQAKVSGEVARAAERYQQQIYQITEDRLQSLLQAYKDYYGALADMALADARRAEDLAIETARRREDWARDAARRRAALWRKYAEKILDAELKHAKKSRRLAEDRARRLLQIERRYQDRLLDIERSYSRSMYDAIATRNATAALQAMRKRKEDIEDAKRDRDRAIADIDADYIRRLRDLRESLKEQREQARKSYEEALAELNIKLAEQEEDLAISLRRREEDARLSQRRQLEDLVNSLAEQVRAVQDQYTQDRRLAMIEYIYREMALAAHLARMQAIWDSYQTGYSTTPAGPTGSMPSFAEGGAMVVTGPTMMQFGEKGTELIIAQPLPPTSQSMSVSGSVKHEVNAVIQQSIAGIEGRIANAVYSALAEVVR